MTSIYTIVEKPYFQATINGLSTLLLVSRSHQTCSPLKHEGLVKIQARTSSMPFSNISIAFESSADRDDNFKTSCTFRITGKWQTTGMPTTKMADNVKLLKLNSRWSPGLSRKLASTQNGRSSDHEDCHRQAFRYLCAL